MNSQEIRAIVEQYLDCYNRFDVMGMMGLVYPAIEFQNISGGAVTAQALGVDQFRNLAELSTELFSKRQQLLKSIKIENNTATLEVEFTGVLTADLPSGQKAGDNITLSGRTIMQFREGRISRITDIS